jgi:hypothetical protein
VVITFTTIRPFLGFSNGRDVSLLSVAQGFFANLGFRVVFSAPLGSFAQRRYAWRSKKLSSL